MNIEAADTIVATMVATTATRKMAGSKAEPDPVPLLNVEDMNDGNRGEKCSGNRKALVIYGETTRPLGERPALPA